MAGQQQKLVASLIALMFLTACTTGTNGGRPESTGATTNTTMTITATEAVSATGMELATVPQETPEFDSGLTVSPTELSDELFAASSRNADDFRFSNPEGETIYVGMSRSEFENVTGEYIENNWYYTVQNGAVTVLSIDDTVHTLVFSGSFNYSLGDGIARGSTLESIKKRFGEPDSGSKEMPSPELMQYMIYYDLDDLGMVLIMSTDDELVSIQAGYTADDISGVEGVVYERVSGTGDTVYSVIRGNNGYLEVTHTGDGNIKLIGIEESGGEHTLIDRKGDYSGRIMIPEYYPYGLSVEAEGSWVIRSILPDFQTPEDADSPFYGNGDFVTSIFYLRDNRLQSDRNWKVTNNGGTVFEVILHTGDFFNSQIETLVHTTGAFEGQVSLNLASDQKTTGFFEIISDGSWSIEPIE